MSHLFDRKPLASMALLNYHVKRMLLSDEVRTLYFSIFCYVTRKHFRDEKK